MAETIYDDLLRTGRDLLQFSGYLDTQEKKQHAQIKAAFDGQRNKIVYDLLNGGMSGDDAKARVTADFTAIRDDTDEYYRGVVDHVEGELISRIEGESGKTPLRRRVIRWTPAALGVIAAIVYITVRVYSGVPVDQPLPTQAGIVQQAHAFQKAIRYEEFVSGARHRIAKELLFWPIKPTDAEQKAAIEFAGIVVTGRQELARAKAVCDAPPMADTLTDADVTLIDQVADYAIAPTTKWETPPAFTLLRPIASAYPCQPGGADPGTP